MKDIELVEFPYADDWYNLPEMMKATRGTRLIFGWRVTTSATWLSVRWKPRWKKESSMRYMQTKPLQQVSEATGSSQHSRISRSPDRRLQVDNIPAGITGNDVWLRNTLNSLSHL